MSEFDWKKILKVFSVDYLENFSLVWEPDLLIEKM